jgi:hypothetical protein
MLVVWNMSFFFFPPAGFLYTLQGSEGSLFVPAYNFDVECPQFTDVPIILTWLYFVCPCLPIILTWLYFVCPLSAHNFDVIALRLPISANNFYVIVLRLPISAHNFDVIAFRLSVSAHNFDVYVRYLPVLAHNFRLIRPSLTSHSNKRMHFSYFHYTIRLCCPFRLLRVYRLYLFCRNKTQLLTFLKIIWSIRVAAYWL